MTNRKTKKSRPIRLLAIGAGLVLSVTVLFLWSHSRDDRSATGRADGRSASATSVSARQTGQDADNRSKLLAAALGRQITAETVEPDEDEETPINVVFRSKEERRRRAERMKKISPYFWEKAPGLLEELLQEQPEDRHWSAGVEASAKKFLEQDHFEGTEIIETDCHATLCKMLINHDNEDAYEAFKQHGATSGPWLMSDIQGKRESLDSGEVVTTFYFSREEDDRPFEEMRERLLKIVNAMDILAPSGGETPERVRPS